MPGDREALELAQQFKSTTYLVNCLYTLVVVLSTRSQPEDAADAVCLYGASEIIRETYGIPLEPIDQKSYSEAIAALHHQIDDASFQATLAKGRGMTPEEACDYALRLIN